MLDLDRSAARGETAVHRLIACRHDSALGNAEAHKHFRRVKVHRWPGEALVALGDPRAQNLPSARAFVDREIELGRAELPPGIEIIELS